MVCRIVRMSVIEIRNLVTFAAQMRANWLISVGYQPGQRLQKKNIGRMRSNAWQDHDNDNKNTTINNKSDDVLSFAFWQEGKTCSGEWNSVVQPPIYLRLFRNARRMGEGVVPEQNVDRKKRGKKCSKGQTSQHLATCFWAICSARYSTESSAFCCDLLGEGHRETKRALETPQPTLIHSDLEWTCCLWEALPPAQRMVKNITRSKKVARLPDYGRPRGRQLLCLELEKDLWSTFPVDLTLEKISCKSKTQFSVSIHSS